MKRLDGHVDAEGIDAHQGAEQREEEPVLVPSSGPTSHPRQAERTVCAHRPTPLTVHANEAALN